MPRRNIADYLPQGYGQSREALPEYSKAQIYSSLSNKGKKELFESEQRIGQAPPTYDGFFGELGEVAADFPAAVARPLVSTAQELGFEWGDKAAKALEKYDSRHMDRRAPAGYSALDFRPGSLVRTVGNAAASTVPAVVLGTAGAAAGSMVSPGVGTAAGWAAGVMASLASTYGDEVKQMRQLLPDRTEEDVRSAALLSSGIQALIEVGMGPEAVLRKMVTNGGKKMVVAQTNAGVLEALKQFAKEHPVGIKGFLTQAVKSGGEEAGEEAMQYLTHLVVSKAFGSDEQFSGREMLENSFAGLVGGFFLGGVGYPLARWKQGGVQNAVTEGEYSFEGGNPDARKLSAMEMTSRAMDMGLVTRDEVKENVPGKLGDTLVDAGNLASRLPDAVSAPDVESETQPVETPQPEARRLDDTEQAVETARLFDEIFGTRTLINNDEVAAKIHEYADEKKATLSQEEQERFDEGRIEGVQEGDTFYLRGQGRDLLRIQGHEFKHWLDKTHPDLASYIDKNIDSLLNDSGRRALKREISHYGDNAEARGKVEFAADMFGGVLRDGKWRERFLGTLNKLDRDKQGLAESFLRAVKEFVNKITAYFGGKEQLSSTEQTLFSDYQKLSNEVGETLAEIARRRRSNDDTKAPQTPSAPVAQDSSNIGATQVQNQLSNPPAPVVSNTSSVNGSPVESKNTIEEKSSKATEAKGAADTESAKLLNETDSNATKEQPPSPKKHKPNKNKQKTDEPLKKKKGKKTSPKTSPSTEEHSPNTESVLESSPSKTQDTSSSIQAVEESDVSQAESRTETGNAPAAVQEKQTAPQTETPTVAVQEKQTAPREESPTVASTPEGEESSKPTSKKAVESSKPASKKAKESPKPASKKAVESPKPASKKADRGGVLKKKYTDYETGMASDLLGQVLSREEEKTMEKPRVIWEGEYAGFTFRTIIHGRKDAPEFVEVCFSPDGIERGWLELGKDGTALPGREGFPFWDFPFWWDERELEMPEGMTVEGLDAFFETQPVEDDFRRLYQDGRVFLADIKEGLKARLEDAKDEKAKESPKPASKKAKESPKPARKKAEAPAKSQKVLSQKDLEAEGRTGIEGFIDNWLWENRRKVTPESKEQAVEILLDKVKESGLVKEEDLLNMAARGDEAAEKFTYDFLDFIDMSQSRGVDGVYEFDDDSITNAAEDAIKNNYGNLIDIDYDDNFDPNAKAKGNVRNSRKKRSGSYRWYDSPSERDIVGAEVASEQVNQIIDEGTSRAEYQEDIDNATHTRESREEFDRLTRRMVARRGGRTPFARDVIEGRAPSDRYVLNAVRMLLNDPDAETVFTPEERKALRKKFIEGATQYGRDLASLRRRRVHALTEGEAMGIQLGIDALVESANDPEALRRKIAEDFGVDISNLSTEDLTTPERLNDILLGLYTQKATVWDKAYEVWINGILSGIKTHVVNTLGNTANLVYEFLPRRAAEALVNLFAKRPDGATFGELKYLWKNLGWRHAADAFRKVYAMETLGEGGKWSESSSGPAIKGPIGGIIRTPSRFLRAADAFAKALAHPAEASAYAYRIGKSQGLEGKALAEFISQEMENPESKSNIYADQRVLELTFQEDAGLAVKHLTNLRNKTPFGRYFLPFIKTPVNLLRQGIRKGPLGLAGLLVDTYQIARGRGSVDNAYIAHAAEQIVAWGTALLLMGLHMDDDEPWITGNETEQYGTGEQQFRSRHIPPMSIRIGNNWFSYARIEPLSTGLAAFADGLAGLRDASDGASVTSAVRKMISGTGRIVADKSYLDSVRQLMEIVQDPEKSAMDYASSYIGSWVPNIYRQMRNSIDENVPDYRNREKGNEWFSKWWEVTLSKAGLAERVPKRDYFGRTVSKDAAGSGVGAFLERLLSPFERKAADMDPMDRMLWEYNRHNPDSQYYPSLPAPTAKVNGRDVSFVENYDELCRVAGEQAYKELRFLAKTRRINTRKPSDRDIATVKSVLARARKRARELLVRQHKEDRR